jgi:hypothetical protein
MRRWLVALVLLVLLCPRGLGQGLLQQLRQDTRSHPETARPVSPSSDPAPARDSSLGSSNGLEGDDGLAWLAGGIVLATSPVWAPILILGDDWKTPAYFPAHPYTLEKEPYLDVSGRSIDNEGKHWLDADYLKPWAAQLSVENGNNLDNLNRLGGRLFIDTTWRFGLAARWDYLSERLGDGHGDWAHVGDSYLTFRLAQCSWGQVHAGLGARWLIDSQRKTAGVSVLYSGDFFPMEPVIISTAVDLGNLGSAFVIRARLTVGAQLGRWEVFGGYEFQRIGDVNIQGPLIGVRRWF